MLEQDQQLTADIMRRVRFLHGARVLMSPAMVRAAAFLASVLTTAGLVSVPSVIRNMSHLAMDSYAPYIASSFAHTDISVKIAVVAGLAVGVWVTVDVARNARYIAVAVRRPFRSA